MKVEKTPSGRFRISEGDLSLEITQASYEDLFFALPLDPPTLFLLLNETVLSRKEDRDVLKKMVAVHGSIQAAMPVLAKEVERCDPKTAQAEVPVVEPDAGGPATDSESRSALAGLVDEVVTRKPAATRAAPPPPTLPVPPARPPGKGKTRKTRKSKVRKAVEEEIPVAEVVTPAPKGAAASAPPPARVAGTPAKGEAPPSERKRQLGILRTPDIEFWITDGDLVINLTQRRYEELHRALPLDNATLYRFVNDSILAGPEERERFQEMVRRAGGVEAALSLLQQQMKVLPPDPTAQLPVRKPATKETPLPGTVPVATAPRPAAPAAGAQRKPPTGVHILDLEVESQTGEKYRIIYGNLMLTLGKAQYQELYYSLPSDNVSLFRLLFTKVLPDPESRGTLKKMVEKAGSNKLFFDSLQIRVREHAPTQSWD